MKKVLAICLMLVLAFSVVATVSAAPNGFFDSPNGKPAPSIEDSEFCDEEDCIAYLVITSYADDHTLPAELQDLMAKAYDEITKAKDLTELCEALAELAKEKNIDGKNLAVSDLFDLRAEGDVEHGHLDFDITLAADSLENFVGLLHRNKNGEWELVTNAKVTNGGTHLQFSVDSLSPFAIVVDTSVPDTGDNSNIYLYVILMAASALALVLVLVLSKKKKA